MKTTCDLSLTSAPARARSWGPSALFRQGAAGAWYDPSDATTLFQDVEGTVPAAADGAPVALIKDKSGNGRDMKQVTSAARPIYRSANGRHWLEFDGVNDQLMAPGNTYTQPTFGAAIAMHYHAPGTRFGAVKSRTVSGIFFGLSHATISGPISNTGGQQRLNDAPAPADRVSLRTAMLQPAVLGAYGVNSAQFSGFEWQIVGHSTAAPDAASFFGYIEIDGMDDAQMSACTAWLAKKAQVTL